MTEAREPAARTTKGMRSRQAILDAAASRFEADGFEGATMRAIARDVGIDPAMIARYFGSKERLFLEATAIDLAIPALDDDPDVAAETLARHAVALWASERPGRALRILLRAAATDADAADRIRAVFAEQVRPLLQDAGDDADVAVRVAAVTWQILGYAFGRYVVRLPPMVDAADADLARILATSLRAALRTEERGEAPMR